MRQYILITILLFAVSFPKVNAQTRGSMVVKDKIKCESSLIHFRFDKSVVDSGYMNNALSLRELDRILTDKNRIAEIDSVVITASGSPDGVVEYNQALVARRAKAMKGYIIWKYPSLNRHLIFTHSVGEDWVGLQRLVEADGNVPYKEQILKVLTQDINPATKEWRLKQIDSGKAWSYITNHYLKYLRTATTCVVYYQKQEVEKSAEQPIELIAQVIERTVPIPQEVVEVEQEQIKEDTPDAVESIVEQPIPSSQAEIVKRPLFALKTNLLFDMAAVLNVEIEVPLAKQWSVAGEWMFPWWLWENQQHCLQVLSGNLEFRYWFKPNFKKQNGTTKDYNPLAGWFVGVYGGGGLYDIEWDKKGYQGEFYIAAGISGGYVQPISRSLLMEFSLGVGYLQTDYRGYESMFSNVDNKWHQIRQQNGSYTWIGPTKAKISLIWYPHFKKKGGHK